MKFLLEKEETTCVICKQPIDGFGNNAEPVAKGRCCDKCNKEKVIPARIKQIQDNKNVEEALEQGDQEKVDELNTDLDRLDKEYDRLDDKGQSTAEVADEIEEVQKKLDESENPLKDAAEEAKKHQDGQGYFVKMNAGDVEKGIETFNHMMGAEADGNIGTTTSGEGMGEDLEEPKPINIRQELNNIDMEQNTELRNMYDAIDLLPEDKEKIVRLIADNQISDLKGFIEDKYNTQFKTDEYFKDEPVEEIEEDFEEDNWDEQPEIAKTTLEKVLLRLKKIEKQRADLQDRLAAGDTSFEVMDKIDELEQEESLLIRKRDRLEAKENK